MKIIQKLIYPIGFLPAFIYSLIFLFFAFYRFNLELIPLLCVTLALIIIPFFISHHKYEYVSIGLISLLSIIFIYYSRLPNQSTPDSTLFQAIFYPIFFFIYYYFLNQE